MGNCFFTDACPASLQKTRDPAFEWNIYGFSALLERGATSAYSACFHCSGYEWFLQVIPEHKESGDIIPYVALKLSLNPICLKLDNIVNAVFEFSIYNHSSGTYHGGKASYNFSGKMWYSSKMCLIPLEELLKSPDYLVDDSCVFGVRMVKMDVLSTRKKRLVISQKAITVQNLFLQRKDFIQETYTWTMSNYLDSSFEPINSPAFEVGGHKWYIRMDPIGCLYSTNSVALFLCLHDPEELSDPESGMMIELALSILDEKNGQHYTCQGCFVFAAGNKNGWGWHNFIPLKTFKDPSRGYLVGANCVVKADITIIGSSNDG